MDVLASNAIARAVSPAYAPGTNVLRAMFLDTDVCGLHEDDLDRIQADAVSAFRAWVGGETEDPALQALIGELSLKSERFRELWARHDVRASMTGDKRFLHPAVGELRLRYQMLAVPGVNGETFCVMHAEPGGRDEQALLLGTPAAEGVGDAPGRQVTAPR